MELHLFGDLHQEWTSRQRHYRGLREHDVQLREFFHAPYGHSNNGVQNAGNDPVRIHIHDNIVSQVNTSAPYFDTRTHCLMGSMARIMCSLASDKRL